MKQYQAVQSGTTPEDNASVVARASVAIEQRQCLICARTFPTAELTDEHVFPASIGGALVAKRATCKKCARDCSSQFEAKFLTSVKVLSNSLKIANRQGDIPSIRVTFKIDGEKYCGVLSGEGEIVIQNRCEKETINGKTVRRYRLFDEKSVKQVRAAAAKRGERLVIDETAGHDIEFTPESFMPLAFLTSLEAKRVAAKVALTCLAAKLGHKFASFAAFDDIRRFVRESTGTPVLLFFNQNFAQRTVAAPFQHFIILSCDAHKHTAHAIVVFFGTMTYVVKLSSKYDGLDFGWHYAFDARQHKEMPVFVGNIEDERLAVEDVLYGNSKFDDVLAVAKYGAAVIQSVALPRKIRAIVPTDQ